jgi:sRNA-binding regulator protein Hfq
MKTKTHFAFRIDIWDNNGVSIVEHVAGVDDFEVAVATGGRNALALGSHYVCRLVNF